MQHVGMEFNNLQCLRKLTRLKVAKLSYNSINFIPDFSFAGLKNLRRLDLTGNNLTYLSDNSLKGLEKTLRQIILKRNKINILSECTFHGFRILRDIELSSNPLQCDCNLAWLMDWANRHYGRYRKGALDWQCQSPQNLRRKYFRSLEKEDFKCNRTQRFSNSCTSLSLKNITSTAEGRIPLNHLRNNVSTDSFSSVHISFMQQKKTKSSTHIPNFSTTISANTIESSLNNSQNRESLVERKIKTSNIGHRFSVNKLKPSGNKRSVFQAQHKYVSSTTVKPRSTGHHKNESEKSNNFGKNTKQSTNVYDKAITKNLILQTKSNGVPAVVNNKQKNGKPIKHSALKPIIFSASESPRKLVRNLQLDATNLVTNSRGSIKSITSTESDGTNIMVAVSAMELSLPPSTSDDIKLFEKNNKTVIGNATGTFTVTHEKASSIPLKINQQNSAPKINQSSSTVNNITLGMKFYDSNKAQQRLTSKPPVSNQDVIQTYRPFVSNSTTAYFLSSSRGSLLSESINRSSALSPQGNLSILLSTSSESFLSSSINTLWESEINDLKNTSFDMLKSSEHLESQLPVSKKSKHIVNNFQKKRVNHRFRSIARKSQSNLETFTHPYVATRSLKENSRSRKNVTRNSRSYVTRKHLQSSTRKQTTKQSKNKPTRPYNKLKSKKISTKPVSYVIKTTRKERNSTHNVFTSHKISNAKFSFAKNVSVPSSSTNKTTTNHVYKRPRWGITPPKESTFSRPTSSRKKRKQLVEENQVLRTLFSKVSPLRTSSSINTISVAKMMGDKHRKVSSVSKADRTTYATKPFSFITQSSKPNSGDSYFSSTINSVKMSLKVTNGDKEMNIRKIQNQTSRGFHIDNLKAEQFKYSSTMGNLQSHNHAKHITLSPNDNNNFAAALLKERRKFNESVIDNMISEDKRIDVEQKNKASDNKRRLYANDSIKAIQLLRNESFTNERNFTNETVISISQKFKRMSTSKTESLDSANDKPYTNPTQNSKWRIDRNIGNVTQSSLIQKKIFEEDNVRNSTSNINLLLGKSYISNIMSITNRHDQLRNKSKDKFKSFDEATESLKQKMRMEVEGNMRRMLRLSKNSSKPISTNSYQDRIINFDLHKIKRNSSSSVSLEVRWNVSLSHISKITAESSYTNECIYEAERVETDENPNTVSLAEYLTSN
ncbi:leucine-rich repeats and immunoglobulin-like domains protein 1 [Octopus vulgaris]|uniref:Leucine-rich repeats and immunoglobulin-like domains protein 1 n=1 Tax=Octopus vulgaris TaxID=6645 RepID=A0AA36ATT5_OCTVU|nr:leucine-rich repeats and immunoglobulin-like domains protein 1 [Octopus vulgaris]